jgi:signal transduction histidine kinase
MSGPRSFRQRIFLAIVLVALVPSGTVVALGALGIREVGTTVGTLGPWDAVASSGRTLMEEARRAAPGDTAVARAARSHGEVLSRSLQGSRLWSLMSARAMGILPWVALGTVAVVALLAFLTAGRLATGFATPIRELVGWTRRITRGEPLPADSPERDGKIEEFRVLRDALREMAGELEEARTREVESARLRAWTEIARRVAHELKNPLTPMRMALASLPAGPEPGDSSPGSAAREILAEEIDRLDEMARSFSQFGHLPESPPSPVDVEELLADLARLHGGPSEGIRVEVDPDLPRVVAHLDLLTRALRNLVLNALEAMGREEVTTAETPEGATPSLLLSAERRPEGGVRIRVRDRGPGLPPEAADRIWDPGFTTRSRGTGLGLAVVRQAAEFHGGGVRAFNRPDPPGAEFVLELPARPDASGRTSWTS